MFRFFVSPEQIVDGTITLTGSDVNHISNVLRLGKGDRVVVLDGQGRAFIAEIVRLLDKHIVCDVAGRLPEGHMPPVKVTLVQGLPKGSKMDLIVQKGTELGVARVIPLLCRRTIVKLSFEDDKFVKRQDRWQRIAREAAEQCGRFDVPEVTRPAGWQQVLQELPKEAVALLLWEKEADVSLKSLLHGNKANRHVYVFIGPEGGFDPGEVEEARAHGVRPVTIGPRILRTETAGLVVISMILYQWGDLGGEVDK